MSSSLLVYPVNILQWVIAFTYLFSAVLLWTHKSYRILVFILLENAVLMLLNFGEETRLLDLPVLITPLFTLFNGPALFLFVRQLVYPDVALARRDGLHLLPVLLAIPMMSEPQWVIALGTISLVVYLALSTVLLLRYEKVIVSVSADAQTLSLEWMLGVIGALIGLLITDFIRLNLQPVLGLGTNMSWYFAQLLGFFIALLYLVFRTLQAPKLFTQMSELEAFPSAGGFAARRKNISRGEGVDKDFLQPIFQQIDTAIKESKLYLQPRLSLLDLSKQYGLQTKDISAAINQIESKNFNDYINALRLTEWQAKVDKLNAQERQQLSVLTLAMDVGFNSKSTFNQAFKKQLSMTPSQYLLSRS